jgi:hypothetical protein
MKSCVKTGGAPTDNGAAGGNVPSEDRQVGDEFDGVAYAAGASATVVMPVATAANSAVRVVIRVAVPVAERA